MKILDSSKKLLPALILSGVMAISSLANASPETPNSMILKNLSQITSQYSPEQLHNAISYSAEDNNITISSFIGNDYINNDLNISFSFDDQGAINFIESYRNVQNQAQNFPTGYTTADTTISSYENKNDGAFTHIINDKDTITTPDGKTQLSTTSSFSKHFLIEEDDGVSSDQKLHVSDIINAITHSTLSDTFEEVAKSKPSQALTNTI